MNLRDYQQVAVDKAASILEQHHIVYLAMNMRTGKTHTALSIANTKYLNVLFVTKKKAIDSIQKDYDSGGYFFALTLTNYESLHKVSGTFDLVIVDEAHSIGAFPKPAKRTKELKKIVGNTDVIFLSGTPSPESYSQLYHQFYVSAFSPFAMYKNFYAWAKDFVTVKQKILNGYTINDYSDAKIEKIKEYTDKYFVSVSHEEAGFECEVVDKIVYVKNNNWQFVKILKENKMLNLIDKQVIADSPGAMLIKCHQLSSGTIKTDSGTVIIDESKAEAIKSHFEGKKIAIFYKFIAEGEVLKKYFTNWTSEPAIFNASPDKTFICQIQSGREGVNLSTADEIVFYNIDFSAVSYQQARARLQYQNRKGIITAWFFFSEKGIENYIYKCVTKKKNFTASYFYRNYDE